jgi:hypothetical protein
LKRPVVALNISDPGSLSEQQVLWQILLHMRILVGTLEDQGVKFETPVITFIEGSVDKAALLAAIGQSPGTTLAEKGKP